MFALVRAFVLVAGSVTSSAAAVLTPGATSSTFVTKGRASRAPSCLNFVSSLRLRVLIGRKSLASSSSLLSSKYRKSSLNVSRMREERRRFHDLVGEDSVTTSSRLLLMFGLTRLGFADAGVTTLPSSGLVSCFGEASGLSLSSAESSRVSKSSAAVSEVSLLTVANRKNVHSSTEQ